MNMNTALEIILPVENAGRGLAQTAAALAAQTSRDFGVLLGEPDFHGRLPIVEDAERQLTEAGIAVRRIKSPCPLKPIELWNWTHAQSHAHWLKLLLPGQLLGPAYVESLRQRIRHRPKAQFVRCDLESRTEWGVERQSAPFDQTFVTPAEFLQFFPSQIDWLSQSANFAYSRTAWRAIGGYPPNLPACAALNLNVLLALHFGIENIPETLVSAESVNGSRLNEMRRTRVNRLLELWAILRQAKNYCLAAKLPWRTRWLLLNGISAALGRR